MYTPLSLVFSITDDSQKYQLFHLQLHRLYDYIASIEMIVLRKEVKIQ